MAERIPDLSGNGMLIPWARNLVRQLNANFSALPNNVASGTVTLAFDNVAVTTTVSNMFVNPNSFVALAPTSLNASGQNWWISNRTNGSFLVAHGASSLTRVFSYVIIG